MRPYGDIATLAAVQIGCFLALTQLEPRFLMIHLYQLVPYVAILLLLLYGQSRWAYMIGTLVSAVWLALAYLSGLLGAAVDRLLTFRNTTLESNLVAAIAVASAVLAMMMIAFCRTHWAKERGVLKKTRRTFLVSLALVALYYGVFLRWFWLMIPNA
jgi:hypothetical protein